MCEGNFNLVERNGEMFSFCFRKSFHIRFLRVSLIRFPSPSRFLNFLSWAKSFAPWGKPQQFKCTSGMTEMRKEKQIKITIVGVRSSCCQMKKSWKDFLYYMCSFTSHREIVLIPRLLNVHLKHIKRCMI